MSLPRLLLLSGVMPGRTGVGRVYLRTLCRLYPRDRLACFHLDDAGSSQHSPELDWLPMQHAPPPPETGPGWPGEARFDVVRSAGERWIERTRIPALLEQIVRFGKEQRAEMLWVPLHTPTTIRLARRVAERLDVPLITTVWDPPAYKLSQFRLDPSSETALLREFDETLRASVSCGVASHPMRKRYSEAFGTRCVTMILGSPRGASATQQELDPSRPFRIGFAGCLYAHREWAAFLEALNRREWRIAGRPVAISMLTERLEIATPHPTRIELLGWHEPERSVELLGGFDAGYLPYWFDEAHREVVELAFPGKLATYVGAGLPVLFHGPRDSSPARFLEQYPVGLTADSLDPEEIAGTVERLVADPARLDAIREAGARAYEEELSAAVFRRRFAELLDADEGELLPLPGA